MKKIYIVVGLGFGDEGKGLATDFLCSKAEDPLVVRFNGGHQAGHTVTNSNNQKHTFSNFGSGTLRNVDTYWSKYCTFSPSMTLIEYTQLRALKAKPSLFIDDDCPVTTHYDILYNRLIEISRGKKRYGSCGLGFGATIQRGLDSLHLYAKDIVSPVLIQEKLNEIRDYYKEKIDKQTKFKFSQFDHNSEDKKFKAYIGGVLNLIDRGIFNLVKEESIVVDDKWKSLIFEGAQGILLDMNYGTFPHVTFSNTTSKNAVSIVSKYYSDEVEKNVLYVTRAYQTRHGAGPFREDKIELINVENETNINNEFQGKLRLGYLDIDRLNYSIKCDQNFSNDYNKSIIITCIDQLKDGKIYYLRDGKIDDCVYDKITQVIGIDFSKVYFSFSSKPDGIKEMI